MKRNILFLALLISLAACSATPEIHVKSDNFYMEFKQDSKGIVSVDYSKDGRYILSGHVDHTIRLWDIQSGSNTKMLKGHTGNFSMTDGVGGPKVAFSPDNKYFVSGGEDRKVKIWDLSTGNEIKTLSGLTRQVASIKVSPDGKYIIASGGKAKIWEIPTGAELREFDSKYQPFSLAFSGDSKKVLLGMGGGDINLWDIETGRVIYKITGQSAMFAWPSALDFSPDGRYFLSGSFKKVIKIWDTTTGSVLRVLKGHGGTYGTSSAVFSPDGKIILSGGLSDAKIKLWDVSTGAELKTLEGHLFTGLFGVNAVAFSPDGKRFVSGGDASVRLWDTATGKEIALMVGFNDGEWIVITSDGYYNASDKGAQYLSVKVDDISYSVDSFYDVFYRPDIVSAKLRGDDIKDLISITMKDAIKNPPPAIEFISDVLDTDSPKVKICYQAKNTGGGIGEIRLFHNGKLIESDGYYREVAKAERNTVTALNSKAIYDDMRSVSLKGKIEAGPITSKIKGDTYNDCKEIETISGENEVSITAFNRDNTIQGAMKTIRFNAKIPAAEPTLYILALGINEYKDRSITLKYAAKDAKDIEEMFIRQAETIYKPQNIRYELLKDSAATKTNIADKINELSKTVKPKDSFVLFVAGHGVLLQNQYYILTSDYNGTINQNSMISSNEIVEMSKKLKSLSQLFIFDTCHAGGVDTIISGLYDARMSVLAKKMGLHIYASANSLQQALDGYQGNGLFTYTLLDGLNNKKEADKNMDNAISIVELGAYSKQTTSEISKRLGHQQTPLIINFGKDSPLYQIKSYSSKGH